VIAVGVLPGCASPARRAEQDLSTLAQRLPGRYAASTVSMSIETVSAQAVGDNVYYVRETDAQDARLVLWQGIWTLSLDPRSKTVLQRSYLFTEPRRWLRVGQSPELLMSLLPTDLRQLAGCGLLWKATPMGFTASANGQCEPGSDAQGLWLPRAATLSDAGLMLSERRVDAQGRLARSGAPMRIDLRRISGDP
jgi:hypothetical protein